MTGAGGAARPDPVPAAAGGGKGEGRFERIGWDEALGEIAERLDGVVRGSAGMTEAIGSPGGMDPEDLAYAGLILLWGTNPLTSGGPVFHDTRVEVTGLPEA